MTTPLPSPLDNKAVARTLIEIADLLELKGENPFKIRAYRNAADIVSHAAGWGPVSPPRRVRSGTRAP